MMSSATSWNQSVLNPNRGVLACKPMAADFLPGLKIVISQNVAMTPVIMDRLKSEGPPPVVVFVD
jgi:hypothetical protein